MRACAGSAAPPNPRPPPAPSTCNTKAGAARAASGEAGHGLEYWAGRNDLIQAPPPPKPEELALPKVERFTLKNGLEVIVVAAQGAAAGQLRPAIAGRRLRREPRRAGGVRLRRGDAAARHQDPQRRRHLARDRLRRRHRWTRARRNEGTTASCAALSKDAPLCLDLLADIAAAAVVPRGRDGRGARSDAGRRRGALRQPARAGDGALRQPAVRREASRRLGADRRRRQQDHPRAAGDVLEDVLPPEPRHPGGRGRRRRLASLRAGDRQGVRRLGSAPRSRRARLDGAAR